MILGFTICMVGHTCTIKYANGFPECLLATDKSMKSKPNFCNRNMCKNY